MRPADYLSGLLLWWEERQGVVYGAAIWAAFVALMALPFLSFFWCGRVTA